MLVGSNYYILKKGASPTIPPSSTPRVPSIPLNSKKQSNNFNIERPSNSNPSFEGLSFLYKQAHKAPYSAKEILAFSKQHIGNLGEDLFKSVKDSKYAKNLIKIDGDNVTLYKKTIWKLIWDGMVYPIKILPLDLLNGTIKLLGKIKPLKGWSEKTLQKDFFKNIRQRSKVDAKTNSLRGLFETAESLKGESPEDISSKMFEFQAKMFDSSKGNYDTKHERALTRIVSGLPPAVFLANDAYNLSRMMDDNSKQASKEKKTRFKQEVNRVGLNAYIQLITFGALQKYINNSKTAVFLTTGITTLFTEAYARIVSGKSITKLTSEQARALNEKNNAPEKNIEPDLSFKANPKKQEKDKNQKPLLSFGTLMKASAFIITAGFGVKFLRKNKAVEELYQKAIKPFNTWYKKATVIENHTIAPEKFNQIMKVLDDNGFKELSNKYKKVADTARNKDGTINLGPKNKEIKPLVNFVIAPFKFIWGTVTLPYTLANRAIGSFAKKAPNAQKKVSDIKSLAMSIENIGKRALKKDFNSEQFKTYVSDNILKGFNVDSLSNVSNSDLANLAKTAGTAATLWFLMTDNYNMVMQKSNGNDVDGAQTKFKERFVQEGSRLFYQTLLIDLFNSTFSKQYHSSLLGASIITASNTTISEMLTRKSVGTPLVPHTRDELIQLEEEQNNATGFLKGYYNFMRRLTGKRSIHSYNVNKTESTESKNPVSRPFNPPSFERFAKA